MPARAKRTPQSRPGGLSGALQALEAPMLVAVPVVLLWCALTDVRASAGLTLLVVLVCIALFMASYEASRPALRQLMPTVVLAALAAAGRVALAPGEETTVSFTVDEPMLRFWRGDGTFGSEPGAFRLWISLDSASGEAAEVTLKA